ncbi:MAG: late competence development ComFB family protein [Gammaproteobacteria bacterium]|nr:late competence development ComFB family protein [Gammaproteobacteria bacterium]
MSFETIHNYYEQLVLDKINELTASTLANESEDFLCDVACVTLNQLPSRYVRHNVDMVFYMPIQERECIQQEVSDAVNKAIDYVNTHRGEKRPQTISQ